MLASSGNQTRAARVAGEHSITEPPVPELKEELKVLLLDPQEVFRWQNKLISIKWDGVESFHALASRVIAAVDKYDKDMPQLYKAREYFVRFRMAVPKEPYQDAIDLGVPLGHHTIKNAKDVALRAQLTQTNPSTAVSSADTPAQGCYAGALVPYNPCPSGPLMPVRPLQSNPQMALAIPNRYNGASMIQNTTTGLEASFAGLSTTLENLNVTMRSFDTRLATLEGSHHTMAKDLNDIRKHLYKPERRRDPSSSSSSSSSSSGSDLNEEEKKAALAAARKSKRSKRRSVKGGD